jgi:hypothetical protein
MGKTSAWTAWRRVTTGVAVVAALPPVLFAAALAVAAARQDAVVTRVLALVNDQIAGSVRIEGSRISPFADFPRISIDLEGVELLEDEAHGAARVLRLDDVYLGFDLRRLLRGVPEIRSVRVEGGQVDLVERGDGTLNLANALASPTAAAADAATAGAAASPGIAGIDLRAVALREVGISKTSEAGEYRAAIRIERGDLALRSITDLLELQLDAALDVSVDHRGKPTFFRDRHVTVTTALSLEPRRSRLAVGQSRVTLEDAVFRLAGTVDLANDVDLDLALEGDKPNFDLFLAFAPPELATVLAGYENSGRIFFAARVTGPSINGKTPAVEIDFGCENGMLARPATGDALRNLGFRARFSNGAGRSAATSGFTLTNVNADPAVGFFRGDLKVTNFDAPEVDLQLDADLDLDFLARFLGFDDRVDVAGNVRLKTSFREVVDLQRPETALARVGQSYATTLAVSDLRIRSPEWPAAFEDINVDLEIRETTARLRSLRGRYGAASVALSGSVSGLPSLLLQTTAPLEARLELEARNWQPSAWREQLAGVVDLPALPDIERASGRLRLVTTGDALARPGLPAARLLAEGFTIETGGKIPPLRDLEVLLETRPDAVEALKLAGRLGDSVVSVDGAARDIAPLLDGRPGSVSGTLRVRAPLLRFRDLQAAAAGLALPDDWSDERVEQLDLQLRAAVQVDADGGVAAADIDVASLAGSLSVHELPLSNGRGRFHWDASGLTVSRAGARLGESSVEIDYAPGDSAAARPAVLTVRAPVLDFDALTNWSPPAAGEPVAHDSGFSLFDLDFPDLRVELTADRVTYHRMRIEDLQARLVTRPDHSGSVEILDLRVAGGHLALRGDFDGETRERIRFQTRLDLRDVELDQLLFKFENFGQDHLVSENLHGRLTGTVEGLVILHADLTPIVDQSKVEVDVVVQDGMLENFGPLQALSGYFRDRNLARLRFGDLGNRLRLTDGVMEIPAMTVNTSLGFVEVSGQQALGGSAEYLVRVPWRMVTGAAVSRLFGGRRPTDVDPDSLDEIQYRDAERRVRFITLRITSDGDDWRVALGDRR